MQIALYCRENWKNSFRVNIIVGAKVSRTKTQTHSFSYIVLAVKVKALFSGWIIQISSVDPTMHDNYPIPPCIISIISISSLILDTWLPMHVCNPFRSESLRNNDDKCMNLFTLHWAYTSFSLLVP